jgi:polygalacturonase
MRLKKFYFLLWMVGVLLSCSAVYSQKVCDVRSYGAVGDGVTKDTKAIQKAIDDCSQPGGGIVKLGGAKTYVSAPLLLKSNITLEVGVGSTLAASTDHEDFPEKEEFHDHGRQAFLSSDHAENITIDGGGTIDGRGDSWWMVSHTPRPRLIVFDHSRNIRMEEITVKNSPMWQIVPYYSEHLIFRNMKVLADNPAAAHNTDGIDPFSSGDVLIEKVLIDTGDDDIAIKSGQPGSAGPDAPSHDIIIRDCTFLHGHGLSIGSEVSGGVQHVHVERVHFKGTGTGIRIKSNRDRGNDISDLTYRDITMEDVKTAILVTEFYPKIPPVIEPAPLTRLTPHFHDISISNVTATGVETAAVIVGLPESPIKNLRLENVHISAQKNATIEYAEVLQKNLTIEAKQ